MQHHITADGLTGQAEMDMDQHQQNEFEKVTNNYKIYPVALVTKLAFYLTVEGLDGGRKPRKSGHEKRLVSNQVFSGYVAKQLTS